MKKRSWNFKAGLMASALAIGLAGCAQVGNVDVGKTIVSSYSIKSSQGISSFALELTQDPTASLTAEQQRLLDFLKTLKVDITDSKQEGLTKASMKGSISFENKKIPFQLTMTDMEYTLKIEGAPKPIVIRNGASLASPGTQALLGPEMQKQINELSLKLVDAFPKLSGLFTKNFPNPKTISAESATITINGESVQTDKLHIELKGGELAALAKGLYRRAVRPVCAVLEGSVEIDGGRSTGRCFQRTTGPGPAAVG
jgi:hypothetical protein